MILKCHKTKKSKKYLKCINLYIVVNWITKNTDKQTLDWFKPSLHENKNSQNFGHLFWTSLKIFWFFFWLNIYNSFLWMFLSQKQHHSGQKIGLLQENSKYKAVAFFTLVSVNVLKKIAIPQIPQKSLQS